MTTDRMERVREKAREVERTTDELYGSGGTYAAEAFVAGAHRFCTLSDTEWAEMRETVARAICHEDDSDPLGQDEYDDLDERFQRGYLKLADTAMRAVGLQREGE